MIYVMFLCENFGGWDGKHACTYPLEAMRATDSVAEQFKVKF